MPSIKLAFVKRLNQRPEDWIWAEGAIDNGAMFYFALSDGTKTENNHMTTEAPVELFLVEDNPRDAR
jgi:hypothetical protein